MDQKTNGHTEAYLKRQAKNIKKEQGIPYRKALDQAAIAAGFTNYKNFIGQSNRVLKPRRLRVKPEPGAPSPLALNINTFGSRKPMERPNAKMPIATHQELGRILKELRDAGEDFKRFKNAIGDVRNRLDNWLACEFPDHNELPNEIFVNIYYGNQNVPTEYSPSDERKRQLIELCEKAKEILSRNYHDCRPLRELYQKLDAAIKWINLWPQGRKPKGFGSRGKIPAGSFVLIKSNRKPAILIRHELRNGIVYCYSDGGPMTAARDEIVLPKDQSGVTMFKPMRLWLPYVKFTYSNGTELLVNRDYRPLWARKQGKITPVDADSTPHHQGQTEAFFKDGSAPWSGNKQTLANCLDVLNEWGVKDQDPGTLFLLTQAITTGDTKIFRQQNSDKVFPSDLS